jgi:hypothetical protein
MSMTDRGTPTLSVDALSVDAEGGILACAKGVDVAQCGYVKGDKVCGKCGAVPVEMKVMLASVAAELIAKAARLDEELAKKEMKRRPPKANKKVRKVQMEDSDSDEAEAMEVEAEVADDDAMADEVQVAPDVPEGEDAPEETEDEETDEDEMVETADEEEAEEDEEADDGEAEEDEEDEDEDEMSANPQSLLDKFRKARLQQIGVKSADVGQHGYKCAIDAKVYAGGTPPCGDCVGGCFGTKGQVTLLHAEGISQTLVKGDVVDSAYIDKADMFVTTVRRKDGKMFDVYVDSVGEIRGHNLIDSSTIYDPSIDDLTMVTFDEAANIAMMHLQRKDAEVVSIQPSAFEGHEAYVVDIQCKTGESYDVFVGIDGALLGYETLQEPDIEEIEAEAAEIALKSAYPLAVRSELAKAGIAMPDGSFPILAHNDLLNAIQASKRATNQKSVREHIILRAKTIGHDDSIPPSWVEVGATELQGSLDEFNRLLGELDADKE